MNSKENITEELTSLSARVLALSEQAQGGYKAPDGYMTELSNNLNATSCIEQESTQYVVPDGYFANLEDSILKQTNKKVGHQITKTIPMWRRPLVMGMAASLIILIGFWGLVSTDNSDPIEADNITAELSYIEENIDDISYEELYSYNISMDEPSYLTNAESDGYDELIIDDLIDDLSSDDIIDLF